jgi:hypothetical protein
MLQATSSGHALRLSLEEAHRVLSLQIGVLEGLVEQAVPDRAALANARWALTRASRRRTELLVHSIYPWLLAHAPADVRARIRALQEGGDECRIISSTHVGTWTIERVAADWKGYRVASRTMRRTMRDRIAAEQALLYPLLAG